MSRYGLIVMVGLLTGASARAATWAESAFDELSKDFGSVARGPSLSHPFRVKNNTEGTMVISNVRVSCGVCSSANVLKSVLRPGEETAVVARMDTTRFTGVKTITVFVQFSQPQWDEVRLVVTANSRDDVIVTPENLALGTAKRGVGSSATVGLTFLGAANAQVLAVQTESNYIKASVKETKRTAAEVGYDLTARVRGDAPVGRWYSDVWVKTNNPAMPRVRVPLTVEIESALSISPPAVNLGPVALSAEAERKVILRGVKPFKITQIKGTDPNLSVTDSTTESKPVHVLTVHLKGAVPGELNKTLKILTDLPEDAEIDFQTHATVAVPAPAASPPAPAAPPPAPAATAEPTTRPAVIEQSVPVTPRRSRR
jgi:hypothetical protein